MRYRTTTCVVVLLIAIGTSVWASGGTEQSSAVAMEGTGPLTIKMDLMMGPKIEDSWIESELEQRLSDKLDREVNLVPIMLPGWSEANTKINLLMSDPSTRPDMLFWWGMANEYNQWKDAGIIIDMLPYLQQYGANIINYYDKDTLFYHYENGRFFRVPGDKAEPATNAIFLRGDWLNRLDLEAPTTLEEYREVLRAFTEDDPDGNGRNDTFGLAGTAEWRRWFHILAPFRAFPEDFVIDGDGKVVHGSTQPEMKEALAFARDLYVQGYVDPRMVTATSNEGSQIFTEGKWGSVHYFISASNPGDPRLSGLRANASGAELLAIDPIAGRDGFTTALMGNVAGWSYVSISDTNPDPAGTMQVLNELASAELNKVIFFGLEGEHYTLKDGYVERTITPEEQNALGLFQFKGYVTRKDEANISNAPSTIALFNRMYELAQPMMETTVQFRETYLPAQAEYLADVETLRDQIFFGIIAGERDLSEFDTYVEQFYDMGGEEIEAEAGELYATQKDEWEEYSEFYTEQIEPYK